jgi:hypothetical protein
LCIGHSPFLKPSFSQEKSISPSIVRLGDSVVKIDAGLKHDPRVGYHFLFMYNDETKAVKFFKNGEIVWYVP